LAEDAARAFRKIDHLEIDGKILKVEFAAGDRKSETRAVGRLNFTLVLILRKTAPKEMKKRGDDTEET
jgi:hypothetical protein